MTKMPIVRTSSERSFILLLRLHPARVLMWYLCLSKRYTVEDDHVHLYDFAILTDQRGVFTTYIYLHSPRTTLVLRPSNFCCVK